MGRVFFVSCSESYSLYQARYDLRIKIVIWNIRHGDSKRLPEICTALSRHTPDIAVVTEFQNSETGRTLQEHLCSMDLVHHHAADTPARQNSTLNVSRPCFLKKGLVTLSVDQPFRMPYVVTEGLNLAGAYLPILRAKHPYWERLAPWAKRHRKAPLLVAGDFNTGKHFLDESGAR